LVSDWADFLAQTHDVLGVTLQIVIAVVVVITACLSNFTKDRLG
jgi:hypothetical protein